MSFFQLSISLNRVSRIRSKVSSLISTATTGLSRKLWTVSLTTALAKLR